MRAIDRVIEILPIPALLALAVVMGTGWLIKTGRDYPSYAPVLSDKYFQSLIVAALAGVIIFYLLSRAEPFRENESGIIVANFEGDAAGNVRRHTVETLLGRVREDPALAHLRVVSANITVTDDSASRILHSRRAYAVVSGSVISDTLVWFRIYWRDRAAIQMSVNQFPDIDAFRDRFFGAVVRPRMENFDAVRDRISETAYKNARKIAVVIGNSQYEGIGDLLGVERDARTMSSVFEQLGIEVRLITNGTRAQILQSLQESFDSGNHGNNTVIYIYYAGHGIHEGPASILPTDFTSGPIRISEIAAMADRVDGASTYIFLDTVIGSLADVTSPRIAILAAGQSGELIADTADGGVFTRELAAQLNRLRPGDVLYFDALAQAVTRSVVQQTRNENRPLALSFSPRIVAVAVGEQRRR